MKKFTIQLIICLLFISGMSQAAQKTWLGTTTAWNAGSNWNPAGVPTSNDTVIIASTSNNPVLAGDSTINQLTISGGALNLGGYTLTVSARLSATGGSITYGKLIVRGSVATFNGTTFNCKIDAISSQLKLDGSIFNDSCYFEHSGSTATGNGQGGNKFNGYVKIRNSGNISLQLGVAEPDTFNADVCLFNSGSVNITLSYNYDTYFNGNVILENTGTGQVNLGRQAATAYTRLAPGKTLSIGSNGFATGSLNLSRFIQLGNQGHTLSFPGSTVVFNSLSSEFNGSLIIAAPTILLKNSTFNGPVELTKTATTGNQCEGGNIFNDDLIINGPVANSTFRMSTQSGDIYNGDVTLNSSNAYIQLCYSDTSEFKGNISINHARVTFNNSTGTMMFSGSYSQSLNGNVGYAIKKLILNKTNNLVTASAPITIDSVFTFQKGILFTDSINALTIKAGGYVSGASDSSFVSGPIKKIGNSAFTFPIGRDSIYKPIQISAPANLTDCFYAAYKNGIAPYGTDADSAAGNVSQCEHWSLYRITGTSNIYPTLYWKNDACNSYSYPQTKLAFWNGVKWIGATGTVSGDIISGHISADNPLTVYSGITLASIVCNNTGTYSYPGPDGTIITQVYNLSTPPVPLTFCGPTDVTFSLDASTITCLTNMNPDGFGYYSIMPGSPVPATSFQAFPSTGSATLSFTTPGIYIVGGKINNSALTSPAPFTYPQNVIFSVTILPALAISIAGPSSLCSGQNVQLCASPGNLNSYLWSNGTTSACTNVSNPGTYTVTATDVNGCTGNAIHTIASSQFNAQITGTTQSCLPYGSGQINITVANGLGPFVYTWSATNQNGAGQFTGNQFQVSNLGSGNFQISITDQSGCNIILNYLVPPQIPSANINPNDQDVCKWNTIALSGSGVPTGGTFLWNTSGGGNLSCTTCPAPNLTVYSSTQVGLMYTVNGCSTTVNRNYRAIDIPTAPVIVHPFTICDGGEAYVSPVNPLYNYSWKVTNSGGTITSGTGPSLTINPAWPGPIQVFFTATNVLCQNTSQVTIYGCCVADEIPGFPAGMLDWSGRTATQVLNDPNLMLAGLVTLDPVHNVEALSTRFGSTTYMAAINGTFTVDNPLDLDHANICLGPNARIIVNNDQRLLIGEGNHLHSNGQYMWDGIYAGDDDGNNMFSSVEVYTGGSIIEEAQSAINITLPSFTRIGAVTLNRNYRNVRIQSDPNISYLTSDLIRNRIGGVNFTSEFNSITDNIRVEPHLNERPSSGVELNSVRGLDSNGDPVLSVGVSELTGPNVWFLGVPNSFNDLQMGVNIRNSDANVFNNDFNRIVRNQIIRNQGIAVNITGTYDKVKVGGLDNSFYTRKNNFNSNTYGVLASGNNSELAVENNAFDLSELMAVSINAMRLSADVRNNVFQDNNCAVNIIGLTPGVASRNLSITDNNIDLNRSNINLGVNNPLYDGIRLANISPGFNTTPIVRVTDNQLNGEFRNGVYIGNLFPVSQSAVQVRGNVIQLTPTSPSTAQNGMSIEASTNLILESNSVNVANAHTPAPNTTGFYFSNSGANFIKTNSLFMLQRGMRFDGGQQGNPTGNLLSCNYFDDCENGILLNNFNVGQQGAPGSSNGNEFNNVSFQAFGIGSGFQSDWYIPSIGNPPYGMPAQFPPAQFGFEPAVQKNCGCTVQCPQDPCPGCRSIDLNDAIVKYDSLDQYGMTDELKLFEMDLYLNIPDSSGDNYIEEFKSSLTSKDYSQLFQIAKNYMEDSTREDCISLLNEVQTDNFYSYVLKESYMEWMSAESDSLPVNAVIAEGNYLDYGPAVFVARALTGLQGSENLQMRSTNVTYDDRIQAQQFNLWPNPANRELQIRAEGEFINSLAIYNSLGVEVLNQKMSNLLVVSLPLNLPNGYYTVIINGTAKKKLIVLTQ